MFGNFFTNLLSFDSNELQSKIDKVSVDRELLSELKLSMQDDELLKLTRKWVSLSTDLAKRVEEFGKENMSYYIGNYKNPRTIYSRHNITDNRIFTSIETVAPLITAKPAQPVVFNKQPTKDSEEMSLQHEKVLLATYDNLKMKPKLEKVYKHNQLWRIGCLKYGIKKGKIFTKFVIPTNLILDPGATCISDSEFIGEKRFMTGTEIGNTYPKYEQKVFNDLNGKMGTRVRVIEWWTQKYTVTTYEGREGGGRFILEKKKNPHFNYADLTEGGNKEEGKDFDLDDIVAKSTNNFFCEPQIPYVLYQVWNLGIQIIDDTNTLEQCKTLQDAINRRKTQIDINAEKSGNPIKKAIGLSQDMIDKVVNRVEAGDAIGLKQGQDLGYLQGQSLPQFIQLDIEDSRGEIDNIFGTQATLRGERGASETATGRQVLRQGSEDRQATPGGAMELMLEDLYKGWTQLIKVHYKEKDLIPFLGKDRSKEYLKISTDSINDGVEIKVIAGSVIPDDKIAERAEAMELWGANAITLEKMYSRLGWDNPKEEAQKFIEQQAKDQKTQQEILQGEENVKAEAGTNQAQFEQLQNAIQTLT